MAGGYRVHWPFERMRPEAQNKRVYFSELSISAMHGKMDQRERDLILREFRDGGASRRLLITTDLPRRLGVQDLFVINFDLPTNRENYVHRRAVTGARVLPSTSSSPLETMSTSTTVTLRSSTARPSKMCR